MTIKISPLRTLLIAFIPLPSLVSADPFTPAQLQVSQMDFGGTGLMQMPSGRMAPEGELNVGGTFNNDYYHASISLQAMPWLETTIRYTIVQDLLYSENYSFSGDTEYTDKGIDFKLRLLEESNWLPETSIGIRDIGGTGLFDGEFVALSKRFANVDFTLGMGWGYLGQSGNISNPLCSISDKYCDRSNDFTDTGGTIEYSKWFKGSAAIFGGLEYQTPYQPLRFKLEYDSNDYTGDFPTTQAGIELIQHTPWNVGLLYRVQDWGDFRVSYERGDTLTLGFTMHTNFNAMKPAWRDTPEPDYAPGISSQDPQWPELAEQLASNAGYKYAEISTTENNITVKGQQTKYRDLDIAHQRAGLLLSQVRSPDIESYTFIETNQGMDMLQTQYDADKFDQVANLDYIGATLDDAKLSEALPASDNPQQLVTANKDDLSFGLEATLSQSFGSAENFYLYALGVTASSAYRLTPNVELAGSLYVNFIDNYDQFNYYNDSTGIDNFSTPRVRSLFRDYVRDNTVRMNTLQLTWFERFSGNLYFQGYGGYLESMFAGVGAELLYRPENANWAIGADLNLVAQRKTGSWLSTYSQDYFEYDDGGCGGGAYTTECAAYVLSQGETGFLNLYYTPQWSLFENTLLQANIGQFLGQDKGVRFDISKQFDSGVVTGVYASFTDLSSEEFGEGSFTKGFYISIPFDIMTIKPSRNRAVIAWQPLTRDGGQKLSRKYELYNLTDSRSPWFTKPVAE